MNLFGNISLEKYRKTLGERKKITRVHHDFQLLGIELSQILCDTKHKTLYIKLAKFGGKDKDYLLRLAKCVAEKKDITNKGAYFMRVLKIKNDDYHHRTQQKTRTNPPYQNGPF
ncbi:MAG: hypothetical protein FJY91_01445 [Candidatus Harrisonbacteria bacterium]|nr:hypothetical protein [Candidatus Harrisonbacteria bacterium]